MGKLTLSQRQGAMLEATGFKRDAIARIVNVAPDTVGRWSTREDYVLAVEEYGRKVGQEIAPLMSVLQREAVAAESEALSVALEILRKSTVDEKDRIAAANTIHRIFSTLTGADRGAPGEAGVAAAATLIVNLDSEGKVKSVEDQPAIEGHATEQA